MCTNEPPIQCILSKIGDTVTFTFPEGEERMVGVLNDRCVICTGSKEGVKYWDVVDLISFNGETEPWIRIGYYRMRRDKAQPRFAGQTTITETVTGWKTILLQAAREKEWFRRLLEEVSRELKK
jgi:hypothetical protein